MRAITRCPCGRRIRHYKDLCALCDAEYERQLRAWFSLFNAAAQARAKEGRPLTVQTFRASTPEPVLSGDTEFWCVVGRPGDTAGFRLHGGHFATWGRELGLPEMPARVARQSQHGDA